MHTRRIGIIILCGFFRFGFFFITVFIEIRNIIFEVIILIKTEFVFRTRAGSFIAGIFIIVFFAFGFATINVDIELIEKLFRNIGRFPVAVFISFLCCVRAFVEEPVSLFDEPSSLAEAPSSLPGVAASFLEEPLSASPDTDIPAASSDAGVLSAEAPIAVIDIIAAAISIVDI